MSGFLLDSEVCDSEWDETWRPSQGPIKDDYNFTWRAPWKKFQIKVMKSNGLTNQCCSSLLNPLKMQFLTEKDLHLEKLYQVLKKQKYNGIHICSAIELLEIKLISSDVSDIAAEIEAVMANEFDDIILKTIQLFPHTLKLAEKLFWSNLKDGNLTLMSDDTKIFIVGFANMRAIIQKTIDEIDRCSITKTVTLIEGWKAKALIKFSLLDTFSTKFKDVKCTFNDENSCLHLAGLDVTVAEVVSDLEKAFSSLFVAKLAFDPLVLKLFNCVESAELLSKLLDKANIIPVWTVDERDLFVFSRVKTDNTDILKSIVYDNFLAVGFTFKRNQRNAFCKSKYFLGLVKSNKNKLLVVETTSEGVNIAATKKIVHQILHLENMWNLWNLNAVESIYLQDQWSLHLDGKRTYDREYLLQLQFAQTSTEKPKDLPNLPGVILHNPIFRYSLGISVGCVFPYPTQTAQIDRNGTCSSRESVEKTRLDPTPNVPLHPEKNAIKIVVDSRPELLVSGSRNKTSNEVIDCFTPRHNGTSVISAPFADEQDYAAFKIRSEIKDVHLANTDVPLPTVSSQIKSTAVSTQEIDSKVVKEVTHPIRNTYDSTLQLFLNRVPEKQPQPDTQNTFIQQGGNIYSQQQKCYNPSTSFSNKQFASGQTLAQQPNMFHSQSHSPAEPLYPQQQCIRAPQQMMQMGQTQGKIYSTMMYMPPSQPGNTMNSYRTNIIIKPNNGQIQQTMMIPGQIIPTPSTTYNISTTQTLGGNPIPQTSNPSTIKYSVQTTPRSPSSQGKNQPSPLPEKREKKVLQILDPNTGKDTLSDMNMSTTPGSSKSCSKGQNPNETMDSSIALQNEQALTSAIAAMFAKQIDATLKSPCGVHNVIMVTDVPPSIVSTQGDYKRNTHRPSAEKEITLSSVQHEQKPHKADSALKPSRKETSEAKTAEDLKTEELYKKASCILSILTPQNFQTLVKQMSDLEISSEEHLRGVVNLVSEKAIAEPEYSILYASMCSRLQIEVPLVSNPKEVVSFRAILLGRCQKEFEKDKDAEEEIETLRVTMKYETEIAIMKEEIALAETNNRRRYLGIIRFIGELFKLKMLAEHIMHECVFQLLNKKDEESLECLCQFLRTIGKELDTDMAKPMIDQYFKRIKKLVEEKNTSPRVRNIMRDVINLRSRKWVPKNDENNSKTIEQINKNAQLDEKEKMLMLQKVTVELKSGVGPGRRDGGPRLSGLMYSALAPDGNNTVNSNGISMKGEKQTIFPLRLKISRNNVDDNIKLGPSGGAGRFAGWQKGISGGGAKATFQEREKQGRGNRFSIALCQTTPREGPSRKSNSRLEPREGTFKEHEKPALAGGSQLTEEEIIKKTHAILDEYLHLLDIKEALTCVEELSASPNIHLFVVECIKVLERSNQSRRQTGLLLRDLVRKSIITEKQYLQGLNSVLMYAEDMEIDIPTIWQYFAELIGPMFQDGSASPSFLKQACQPLKESGKAGNLVAKILHDASDREGHKKVGILWRDSGLQWSDFVKEDQVEQFLKDMKLDFTVTGGSQPSTPTVRMPIDRIQAHLHDLVVEKPVRNEEIFDWIEANLDDVTTKDRKFIRALMTAVCSSAITGRGNSAKVDPTRINQRGVILQTYLDHQAEFELQALYALQALVHKLEHPPGVLRTLFDTLYDEDIISEDAFNQWEVSKDPAEQEGKGVAMKHVVQFFTWLREPIDEADS